MRAPHPHPLSRLAPSPLESLWERVAPPAWVDSARALYERVPLQAGGNLPFVDVPYDARREAHWADAARVADYAAQLPAGGRRVLDFGPGDGWPALPLAAALPGVAVLGVDPAPLRVRVCTANARRLGLANAAFVAGDGTALPVASGSVDLLTAAASLEEAHDPSAAFAEAARVLRPGGVLRASYQVWRLPVPELETVSLWQGTRGLLYLYARRVQEPAVERRYVLELPPDGAAAEAHREALVAAAAAPHAYGETLLTPGSPLGAPLLERLAPHALRSCAVALRRWTTPWLVEALRAAGFAEVRATAHAGDLARAFARALRDAGELEAAAPRFDALTRELGRAAAATPGDAMVTAVR